MVTRFNSVPKVCNCNSGNVSSISCDAIYFVEVANVVLKGINVTVYTPSISGIVFRNVSNISVHSTTVYSISSNTCAFGILVVQAESLQVSTQLVLTVLNMDFTCVVLVMFQLPI